MEIRNSCPGSVHRAKFEGRLRREHAFLIYRDVDKPKNTVTISQAVLRLHQIAGIEMSADEGSALKTATEIRICVVHCDVDASIAELKLVFARLLGFLNDFHRTHLDEPLQDVVRDELWRAGVKIREYGAEILKRAQAQMLEDEVDEDAMLTCPRCGWKVLSGFEPKEDTCYVCGHIEEVEMCSKCDKMMLAEEAESLGDRTLCWELLLLLDGRLLARHSTREVAWAAQPDQW